MNIAKNMEVIFVAASVLLVTASYASAAIPAHLSRHAAGASVRAAAPMQVVVVSAKRLSAAEKAGLAE